MAESGWHRERAQTRYLLHLRERSDSASAASRAILWCYGGHADGADDQGTGQPHYLADWQGSGHYRASVRPRTGSRLKYASAHDIRRGYAKRLIDAGVSAETVKVVMRHKDFATTEKHYGAIRSTQVAAEEVRQKLSPTVGSDRLVGGLMGGQTKTPQLTAEELAKLKSLLETI